MYFLYRTLTWLGLALAPLYAAGAIVRRPGEREIVAQRLGLHASKLVRRGQGGIWIQAASVGELQVASLLAPRLQGLVAPHPVCLSVTTSAARRLATPPPDGIDVAMTFPLDLPLVASRTARRLTPQLFIAVETELWPNLYASLKHNGTPIALVNGRISDTSLRRYGRIRKLVARTLSAVQLVCARSEEDAQRFISLGVDERRVQVTGDLKWDRPLPAANQLKLALGDLLDGRRVLVAGSTHPGEEEAALEAGRLAIAAGNKVAVILAPRHLERLPAVRTLLDGSGLPWVQRSSLPGQTPTDAPLHVILLDTHGELSGAYSLAHVAFLGGTLATVGGHNPLEAAAAGIPQVSGPHLQNLRETASHLQEAGVLLTEPDAQAVATCLSQLLMNPSEAMTRGTAALTFMTRQRGALDRTVSALSDLLSRSRRENPR